MSETQTSGYVELDKEAEQTLTQFIHQLELLSAKVC